MPTPTPAPRVILDARGRPILYIEQRRTIGFQPPKPTVKGAAK